jgi:predicted permease
VHWIIEEVPWGNLWRTLLSTAIFLLVIGMPIALFTSIDTGPSAGPFKAALLVISFFIASVVVWSDAVPWVGDP